MLNQPAIYAGAAATSRVSRGREPGTSQRSIQASGADCERRRRVNTMRKQLLIRNKRPLQCSLTSREISVKIKFIATVALLLSSVCAHAGTAANVSITNIESNVQGQFLVWVSATISNSPACAVQPAKQFIVDGTTNGGKVIISVAEAAFALGKVVVVTGDNTCSVHSGYETISDIATN